MRLPRIEWAADEANHRDRDVLERLAPHLPVDVPRAVALGRPGAGYPWSWSVSRLDRRRAAGGPAAAGRRRRVRPRTAGDRHRRRSRAVGRSRRSRSRGATATSVTRSSALEAPGALELWEEAMRAPEWEQPSVWIHCDLDARNVLVRDGRLAAVLDWGGVGAGDPAVDVMVAWKLVARDGARSVPGAAPRRRCDVAPRQGLVRLTGADRARATTRPRTTRRCTAKRHAGWPKCSQARVAAARWASSATSRGSAAATWRSTSARRTRSSTCAGAASSSPSRRWWRSTSAPARCTRSASRRSACSGARRGRSARSGRSRTA